MIQKISMIFLWPPSIIPNLLKILPESPKILSNLNLSVGYYPIENRKSTKAT